MTQLQSQLQRALSTAQTFGLQVLGKHAHIVERPLDADKPYVWSKVKQLDYMPFDTRALPLKGMKK